MVGNSVLCVPSAHLKLGCMQMIGSQAQAQAATEQLYLFPG